MRHAPATQRNRDPILAVLQQILPPAGFLLEIASGTGEHAAYMAPRLPGWTWQPSDREPDTQSIDGHSRAAGARNVRPAMRLDVTEPLWPITSADAILCCNMIHIASWTAAEGLFEGAARTLTGGGPLILYGPFRRHGRHTAPSNEAFDANLRAQDPEWGVRCLDTEVRPLAETHGLECRDVIEMPANNLTVVFRRP